MLVVTTYLGKRLEKQRNSRWNNKWSLGTVDTITQEITNRHINPTMKTLFDITNDSEIISSVREPSSDLIEGQRTPN